MRSVPLNSIYLLGLLFYLLYFFIPVMPSLIQVGSLGILFLYIMIARTKINYSYLRWTIAYLSFFLMSVLWAIKPNYALFIIFVRIVPMLVMIWATLTFVKRNASINGPLLIVYAVSLLMLVYIVLHVNDFMMGVRLGDSLNDELDGEKAWNANSVGVCLCFAIFSGFFLFVNQKRGLLLKLSYLILSAIMIIAILLTGSRKSFIILLIPIVYYIYKKQRRHFVIMLLVIPPLLFLLYELVMNVELFYVAIGYRLEDLFAILTDDTTGMEDTSRLTLINYGLKWFLDNPILGVGLHNFRELSNHTSEYAGYNFYAHNNYIELLVDVGLIGLIIYYSAYVYLFKKLKGQDDIASFWGKVFLYVLLFLGVVEVLYYEPLEQMVFCLIFSIVEFNKKKISILRNNENNRCYSPKFN